MKTIFIISLILSPFSHFFTQETIVSTDDFRTVEYSYDSTGKLIKNFSLDKKVELDSLSQFIFGKWIIKPYQSWKKEKFDSVPATLNFSSDSGIRVVDELIFVFNKKQYPDSIFQLNGKFQIYPNNKEGAEIVINEINSEIISYSRIKLSVIHFERNIIFISVNVFKNSISQYIGIYKLTRLQ